MLRQQRHDDLVVPEMETHLKLLYTAITRCRKSLFFVETKSTEVGDAFLRACRELDMASPLRFDDVESVVQTAEQWLANGLYFMAIAEEAEDLEKIKEWAELARNAFSRAKEDSYINKLNLHLESVEFRESLTHHKDMELDLSKALELLKELFREELWPEAIMLYKEIDVRIAEGPLASILRDGIGDRILP